MIKKNGIIFQRRTKVNQLNKNYRYDNVVRKTVAHCCVKAAVDQYLASQTSGPSETMERMLDTTHGKKQLPSQRVEGVC